MATSAPSSYAEDPTLYLYTSLTAGSSHIITATSRLETILKANKVAFHAIDIATDEKARMIWGRRSKGRQLPGLVKYAQVVGDLDQIEEWNEYGELKEQIDDTSAFDAPPSTTAAPYTSAHHSKPIIPHDASEARHISISEPAKSADQKPAAILEQTQSPMAMAMRQAGAEAAAKAGQKKSPKPMPATPNPGENDTTAPVVEPKIATPMADPSADPEMTQAKAPAQLAAEGAKRMSVDKIAETEKGPDASGTVGGSSEKSASNEQQLADIRRTSSIAKAPSNLSKTETQDEVPEEAAAAHYEQEESNSIEKDSAEDAEDNIEDALTAKDVGATDDGEKPAGEGVEAAPGEARDAKNAGVSVGD